MQMLHISGSICNFMLFSGFVISVAVCAVLGILTGFVGALMDLNSLLRGYQVYKKLQNFSNFTVATEIPEPLTEAVALQIAYGSARLLVVETVAIFATLMMTIVGFCGICCPAAMCCQDIYQPIETMEMLPISRKA